MALPERTRVRRLRAGDTVAVVAPAGPVPDELLDAGVACLRSWGLRVVLGKHVRDRHSTLGYLAGTDPDRAADLQEAWCDPEIDGVLCARGGYGSMRTLERIDWTAMAAASPKVFVGSSDITAVHDAFAEHLAVVTLFGPMIGTKGFVESETAREHLRRSLFEPEAVTELTSPEADTLVGGRAHGITYGGNLSLLAATAATPDASAPPAPGIALLEDVTDEPYRLDGYLTRLLRLGWFDQASAIALGSWANCGPPDEVRATLAERLAPLNVPIVWELGFGHCPGQYTVPLGVAAELDADARRLTLSQPALS